MQRYISPSNEYKELKKYMKTEGIICPLLVCGKSFFKLPIADSFDFRYEVFSDFTPNPLYEQSMKGVEFFHEKNCDMIIAVGGGSAIDVAKCIRFYSKKNVPFVAIPTTAGTGSESTRFAVIYKDGEKLSIEDGLCYPDIYILDAALLNGLPINQRIATMLDALSHSIESLWSVNSTEESVLLSEEAISMILEYKDSYLAGESKGNEGMLIAANIAGKAINITKTTAGHAMCYKITSLYGIPHGQAAALCIKGLLPFMIDNIDKCCDKRGSEFLKEKLERISVGFGCNDFGEFVEKYKKIIDDFGTELPKPTDTEMNILVDSVNTERLGNFPIAMTKKDIRFVYERIFD